MLVSLSIYGARLKMHEGDFSMTKKYVFSEVIICLFIYFFFSYHNWRFCTSRWRICEIVTQRRKKKRQVYKSIDYLPPVFYYDKTCSFSYQCRVWISLIKRQTNPHTLNCAVTSEGIPVKNVILRVRCWYAIKFDINVMRCVSFIIIHSINLIRTSLVFDYVVVRMTR